jgi:hypothetical protein
MEVDFRAFDNATSNNVLYLHTKAPTQNLVECHNLPNRLLLPAAIATFRCLNSYLTKAFHHQ